LAICLWVISSRDVLLDSKESHQLTCELCHEPPVAIVNHSLGESVIMKDSFLEHFSYSDGSEGDRRWFQFDHLRE
jgi:hypothetical protein